jgi:hypothetical protein
LNSSGRSSRSQSQSSSHANSTANLLGISTESPVSPVSPPANKKSDPTKDLDSIFGVSSPGPSPGYGTGSSGVGSGYGTGSSGVGTGYGTGSSGYGSGHGTGSGMGSPNSSSTLVNPFGVSSPSGGFGSTSELVVTSTSTSSNKGSSLSEQEISDYFKKSSMLPEGVLYQDEFIKVGFKSEFSKGFGRIALYYFNATSQPLTGFRTFVSPIGSLNVELQPVATVIDPNSQLQQMGRFACTSPYAEPPTMQLSFV